MNFTFNNTLVSVDNVTTSCGAVSSNVIDPGDAHQLRVSLTRVTCNAQFVTLTVMGAHDDQGNTLPSADATLGLLLGDINGDGLVDNEDSHQTKLTADKPPTAPTSAKTSTPTVGLMRQTSPPSKHSAARCCRREQL